MSTLERLFWYLFYPNPGNASYHSRSMAICLAVSLLLIVGSFGIRMWRGSQTNAVTKKLSRSWSSAAFWFGIIGAVLVVARVEEIQFIAMRAWWFAWLAALVAYAFLQFRLFRSRHYEVLPQVRVEDPRDRYLPGKKRK